MATSYSLVHLSDEALLRNLIAAAARENSVTAWVVAHIAEVDRRKLYAPAGYPSMRLYCVHELHLSDDAAAKRIHAARAAREFPAILEALASGRVHLTGVNLLAAHLTAGNADALLAAAAFKSKAEIELLIAEKFPATETLPLLEVVPSGVQSHAPAHASGHLGTDAQTEPRGQAPIARSRVKPVAQGRYDFRFTGDQETHDLLEAGQELVGDQIPPGDIGEIIRRALKLWVAVERKRRFGVGAKPRRNPRRSTNGRYVPKHVRRVVWERDGGQCTYESASGQRCCSRTGLQFDHIVEFARGGEATVENLRLRCRTHNQLTAEQTFGAGFIEEKREAARKATLERQTTKTTGLGQEVSATRLGGNEHAPAHAPAHIGTATAARETTETLAEAIARARATATTETAREDVAPWLRKLGFGPEEVRRATAFCETVVCLPLEDRVRVAISYLRPGGAPAAA